MNHRARRWWVGVACIVGAAWILWFNRGFVTSGFQLFQGDPGDARFTALVTSHWSAVQQFPGGWTDLGFFFPVANTLGFSDTMLAFGLLAVPFSALGILPAFQLSIIVIEILGYASAVAFLRLGPRSPWPLAITGAVLWNFTNAGFVSAGHPQLLALSLVPVVLLGILGTVRARAPWMRIVLGVLTGALFGVIATTAFYIGWFALVGGGITLVIWCVLSALTGHLGIRWRPFVVGSLSFVAGGALLLPVFIGVYAPVLGPSTERSIDEVLSFILRRRELVNVTPTNLVWGRPLEAIFGDTMRIGESHMAPTIGLLICAAIAFVAALVRIRRLNRWSLLGASLLIAAFLLWLAPVDFHAVQPWRLLYELPGGGAIRAIGRIHIMVAAMLGLGLSILVTQWWDCRGRRIHIVVGALAVLLMVEQVNLAPPQLNTAARAEALASIPAPAFPCSSFVLLPPFDLAIPWYETQIDALWVSRTTGLPTWNGYSGVFPRDWALRSDVDEYMRAVRQWRTIYRIQGGCGLNLGERRWLSPAELSMLIDRLAGWGAP